MPPEPEPIFELTVMLPLLVRLKVVPAEDAPRLRAWAILLIKTEPDGALAVMLAAAVLRAVAAVPPPMLPVLAVRLRVAAEIVPAV